MRLEYPYTVTQDEDGFWLAKCPDVRGAATDDRDRATAVTELRDALAAALEGYVNYSALKGQASSFIGQCFASNVLLKSYQASTGRTVRSARPPVFRPTPLTVAGQLTRILANVAPCILSLKG